MTISDAATVGAAALVLLFGCSSSSSSNPSDGGAGGNGGGGASGGGGAGGALTEVCPATHQAIVGEHDVIVCEALFEDAPRVRPPPDGATAYVATDGVRLFVRGVAARELEAEERDVLGLDMASLDHRLYGYAIYAVKLDDQGRVVSGAPAIVIEDAAMLRLLEGKIVEGFVSRHVLDGDFEYEQEPTLPIRLRLDAVAPAENLDPAMEPATAPSQIDLVVENLEGGVTSARGACLPAIVDAGSESPFAGWDPLALRVYRVPGMHGIGDNELVLEGGTLNHMAPAWMVMPHDLLVDDDVVFEPTDFMPHGNPLSMPQLELAIVAGGGEACTP